MGAKLFFIDRARLNTSSTSCSRMPTWEDGICQLPWALWSIYLPFRLTWASPIVVKILRDSCFKQPFTCHGFTQFLGSPSSGSNILQLPFGSV